MAAGPTYEPIATTSPTNNPTELIFTSIPATYTDLVLVVSAKASPDGGDIYIKVNDDGGSNYSWTNIWGNGSTTGSARSSNGALGLLVDYYGTVGNSSNNHLLIANFNNYANTTTYKTCLARSNNSAVGIDSTVTMWRSTAAIGSLKLGIGSARTDTFSTGTVATLYGIAAA
jgi:hypothetical protein